MLRTQGTWDSLIRFLKFTLKKEIYNKFENFLSKLIWRETLFILWGLFGGEKKMQKFTHILFLKKKFIILQFQDNFIPFLQLGA